MPYSTLVSPSALLALDLTRLSGHVSRQCLPIAKVLRVLQLTSRSQSGTVRSALPRAQLDRDTFFLDELGLDRVAEVPEAGNRGFAVHDDVS